MCTRYEVPSWATISWSSATSGSSATTNWPGTVTYIINQEQIPIPLGTLVPKKEPILPDELFEFEG